MLCIIQSLKGQTDRRGTVIAFRTGGKKLCVSAVSRLNLRQCGLLFSVYWWAVPAGVKRLRHEADHAVQSSAEFRNEWRYIPFRHTP